MNEDHDPEQDDRPTPVIPQEEILAAWRLSEQECWTEPSDDDD